MFEAPRHIRSAVAGPGKLAVRLPPYSTIDLRQLLSTVWQGRRTIVYTTLAALAAALLFTALVTRQYTAATQILIDPSDLRAVGNEANPSSQSSDAALLQVESQVQVLKSDAVLRRVISALNLDHDPEFVHGPSFFSELFGGDAMLGDRELVALDELNRHVKVKRTDRTFVVEIDVTSTNPDKAARIANAITAAYLAEQTEVRADAARQISKSLSGQLTELQDRVRTAEDRVEQFKSQNNIVDANGQLVNEQQLTELNRLLQLARYRTAESKARYEQIERAQQSKDQVGAFPEAVQSPTISALRTQYAEIMRREAEQAATLGARHPAVLDIQAQAERLRNMIADEISRIATSARNDYESAKANEQTIEKNVEALKHNSMDTSEAMVRLRELQRVAQANRTVYDAFLTRARETGAQEQLDTKNIHIISKADRPLKRSWPPPTPIMMLAALFVGVAAGSGMVLLGQTSETETESDAAGTSLVEPLRKFLAISGLWSTAPANEVPVLAILPAIDVSFGLNTVDDPQSPVAKEMRKVYDELRTSRLARGNTSVLVLAADSDDDASTVALTLGALAAATQHVLLIDTDLERHTLSAIDAADGGAGLVDVAIGRRQLADAITLDRETNINVVPLVSPDSRRDRRIYDADIKRAFDQTKRYDMVIVTATDLERGASVGFFAGLVDHIVLVARADDYDQAAIAEFIARFALDRRKVAGAVLTGAAA